MKHLLTSIALILAISIGAKSQVLNKPVFSEVKLSRMEPNRYITLSFKVDQGQYEKELRIQMAIGSNKDSYKTIAIFLPDTLRSGITYNLRFKLPVKY